MPNSPIVNAGIKYVNGLALTWVSNTTLTLGAGAARNSTNINDIILSAAVTINGANVGANGVDIAALEASKFYAVYVIGDSTKYNDPAGLLSLNLESPTLPGNYDMYRRVGYVLTNSSSHIRGFWQYGLAQDRMYFYDLAITALNGGSATTFTAINFATSIPPIATEILLDLTYTPNGATDLAEFLPFGSSETNGIIRFGTGVAGAQVGMVTVPARLDGTAPKVLYKVTSGDTLTALVAGYKDYLN